MVTMQDVADKAGVSRVTVSRVLSNPDSVKYETKRKILYWIKELGYEPDRTAQSLAGSRSGLIGLIVPDTIHYYYAEIVQYAEQFLSNQGYNLILCCSRGSLERTKQCLNLLHSRKVDGVLLFPPGNPVPVDYQDIKTPLVFLGKPLDSYNSVVSDLESGTDKISRYFLNNNHLHLGYVGPTEGTAFFNKYVAYKDFAKKNHMILENVVACKSTNEGLYHILEQYFLNHQIKSTAWFAHNDEAGIILLKILLRFGYQVPDDVIVAGYDNTNMAVLTTPSLTSVRQPIEEMMNKACELLISDINNPALPRKLIKLDNLLIVRESTLKSSVLVQGSEPITKTF